MEKIKKKVTHRLLPASKMVSVSAHSEHPSHSEPQKLVLPLYPKLSMPAQPQGYLKADEYDCF